MPFEGYFWRIVAPASGVVVVALSGVCRAPDGPWALEHARGASGRFRAHARSRATATADPRGVRRARRSACCAATRAALAVDMGPDARPRVTLHDAVPWPRRAFGALGPRARRSRRCRSTGIRSCSQPACAASVRAGDARRSISTAPSATPRRTGASGFPGRWWWGHAATFGDGRLGVVRRRPRARCSAATVAPTAVVVRLGGRVIALAPPLARTRVALGDGAWRLRTRGRGYDVEIEGDGRRRAARTSCSCPSPASGAASCARSQHLAGRLALRVRRGRRLLYDGRSRARRARARLPLSARSARRAASAERLGARRAARSGRSRTRAPCSRSASGGRPARPAPRCTARRRRRPRARPSGRTARARCPARPRRANVGGPASARVVALERPDPAAQPRDQVALALVEHRERVAAEELVVGRARRACRGSASARGGRACACPRAGSPAPRATAPPGRRPPCGGGGCGPRRRGSQRSRSGAGCASPCRGIPSRRVTRHRVRHACSTRPRRTGSTGCSRWSTTAGSTRSSGRPRCARRALAAAALDDRVAADARRRRRHRLHDRGDRRARRRGARDDARPEPAPARARPRASRASPAARS